MRSAPPRPAQPQRHNISSSQEAFVAVAPLSPTPTAATTTLRHRSQSQSQSCLQPQTGYEDVDITTLYPPNPRYDIAEKPWLPGPQTPYVIFNAQLVDPRNSVVHEDVTLHLAGGKLVSVAPTTENDRVCEFTHGNVNAVKIDAKGYFVCPGFIDCHVHLMAVHGSNTLHGAFTFPHEQAIMRSAGTLRGILSNGFTTVRDTGGATIAHAKATEEFLIPGPRVFQGGRMLSQTGGHGDNTEIWGEGSGPVPHNSCCGGIGPSALGRVVDGVDECIRATRDNMRKGANHIKVCTSGGIASETDPIDSIQFSIAELKAITSTCHNMKGTLVTAHCYTVPGILHAIEGGVRGIEHGNMLDAPTASLMASKNVFLTPTLALHTFVTMPPYDQFETPEGLRKNAIVGNAGVKAIRIAEDAGVVVCYGTDTTGPTLVMQTYEFVVRSKILPSPVVLRQATVNGAKQLGMEGKLGELIPGAFADLLFLRENPLVDVASLDRVNENLALIIKDGRVVKRVSLFGTVFAAPSRRYFLLWERLRFPGGFATGVLIGALHKDGEIAHIADRDKKGLSFMDSDGAIDAVADDAGDDASPEFSQTHSHLSSTSHVAIILKAFCGTTIYVFVSYFIPILNVLPVFGPAAAGDWLWFLTLSPVFTAFGMILDLSVACSIVLGAILGWGIFSPIAKNHGWAPGLATDMETGVRGWLIWISIAFLLGDAKIRALHGLTSITLGLYNSIRSQLHISAHCNEHTDTRPLVRESTPCDSITPLLDPILHQTRGNHVVSSRTVLYWLLLSTSLCAICTHLVFGREIPLYLIVTAVAIAFPLCLVAIQSTATDAPYWKTGAITMIVISFLMFGMLWVVSWLDRFTLAKEQRENSDVTIESIPIDSAKDSLHEKEK
ncbi:Uncharacterized protein LSUE1_G003143 [Lachnellula suecica]|uniref:Amidohydrolase-related domain-containing protein n=1 Tax=Lachnellula suecica TaxID=602035 RepID=A0A8T9CJN5_9HELO|nr:Uncharacterized protein LSUE1_G003143 [Lachnellula suecica]